MTTINTVLCAVDPSQQPEQFIEQAVRFTSQLNASQLILFHAFENRSYPTSDGPIETLSEETQANAEKELAALENTIDTNVNLRIIVIEGDPVSSILATAEREKADLLIVGTAGRKGLTRMVMGSVAEGVTRKSHVPVLVLRSR